MRHGWARRDRKGTTNLPLSLERQGYWGQALPRVTWPAGGRGRAPNSDALSLKACVAHSSKPTFCPILVFDSHHPGFLLKSLPRSVLPVRSQKDQSHIVQGARLKPRCARLFQTVYSAALGLLSKTSPCSPQISQPLLLREAGPWECHQLLARQPCLSTHWKEWLLKGTWRVFLVAIMFLHAC